LSVLGRAPEAQQQFEYALEILEALPGEPTARRQVSHGSVLMGLGILARRAGRLDGALTVYNRALQVVTSDSDKCLHLRVILETNRGNVFDDAKAYEEGLESAERAIALAEPLVSRQFRWMEELALAWKSKAMRLMCLGIYSDAIAAFQQAFENYESLRRKSPRPDLSEELGKLFMGLSVSQRRAGNLAPAREAITLGRRFFIEASLSKQAQAADVVAFADRALAEVDALMGMTPTDVARFSLQAAEIEATAGQLGRSGNVQGAIQVRSSALDIHDRIIQLVATPERLAGRAQAYMAECITRLHRGHYQAAWDASSCAVADLEQALRQGVDLWPMWGKAKFGQANVAWLAGNEDAGREIAQSVLARPQVSRDAEWPAVLSLHRRFLESGPG
jgi:hypothetical protein